MILLPNCDLNVKWYVIDGVAYRKSGWFGCQLESYRWTKPAIGERIVLKDYMMYSHYELEIVSAKRDGLLVRCTWRLPQNCDYDVYGERIKAMNADLDRLC